MQSCYSYMCVYVMQIIYEFKDEGINHVVLANISAKKLFKSSHYLSQGHKVKHVSTSSLNDFHFLFN